MYASTDHASMSRFLPRRFAVSSPDAMSLWTVLEEHFRRSATSVVFMNPDLVVAIVSRPVCRVLSWLRRAERYGRFSGFQDLAT